MNNHKKNAGFSLIELMVTIGIVSILAQIALPSFSRLMENNRISSATNNLVASMVYARSEALKRRDTVTMCPSSDQANCTAGDFAVGWIVFLDCNADGSVLSATDAAAAAQAAIDAGEEVPDCLDEKLIKVDEGFESINIKITSAAGSDKVSFNYTGRPNNILTLELTGGTGASDSKKEIALSRVGRVKATTATATTTP